MIRTGPQDGDVLELLTALVGARSPNPPGDERAVAAVLCEALSAWGIAPPQRLGEDPRRPNLLASIGEGSPRLLLVGHMDTMPPGELASWESDPYQLQERDGRLYGLGSADMKSGLAVALLAAAASAAERSWRGTIDLLFVADEENCSEFGMKWLARGGLLHGDAAIILEPAGNAEGSWDRLFVTQRGSAVVELIASGRPGHSAALIPASERAGVALARAMVALADAELFAGRAHAIDATPPTVNIGTMLSGGITPFMHPESLSATVEIRTIEGMTKEDVHAGITAVLSRAGLSERVEVRAAAAPLDWVPPGGTADDERLLTAVATAWRSTLGREPERAVLLGVTDSCWLSGAGIPTLPALGCGSLAVAHQPNEWVSSADLHTAFELTKAVVSSYFASR